MFAINNFREYYYRELLCSHIYRVRTIIIFITTVMADVGGSSLFGEALLWTKFNGIIERLSRTYITMEQYLHIIRCKTIELSTHLKT